MQSKTVEEVFSKRILSPGESVQQMFERVSRCISRVEKSKGDQKKFQKKFLDLLCSKRFLPNSPTLMNAQKKEGQLSACFVLPVPPGIDGVFSSIKDAAKIHSSGGGTGFDFSRLNGADGLGVLEGLRLFDQVTQVIKQGGVRRGANMGVLHCDHPELENFIRSKLDGGLSNFNISVGITNKFLFKAMQDPFGNEAQRLELLSQSAWQSGDPGVLFLDRLNYFNPTPKLGKINATNPCGEQPLLDFESCNLGSINVGAYYNQTKSNHFDWGLFASDIELAVRFLDNVIDANAFPVFQSKQITLKNRKIGLGIMGFADLLILLGVKYGGPDSFTWAERIMEFLWKQSVAVSQSLAKEKGSFGGYAGSIWSKLGMPKIRNATLTTIAPTGTISILAECSSGIEPHFSAVLRRRILEGSEFLEPAPILQKLLPKECHSHEGAKKVLGQAWVVSHEVRYQDCIEIQARFQRFSDSAVSKTINFPAFSTVDDVKNAYLLAFEKGCKGITVYRDGSKQSQVLSNGQCEVCVV